MADKKISALTAATTPLAGTEVLPIVQSGSTVKVAVSDLTAGRAVSALSYTAGNLQISGNTIISTDTNGNINLTPKGTGPVVVGNYASFGTGSAYTSMAIQSSAAGGADLNWKTGTLNRWILNKAGAETGSDAGSDLILYRYNDAGGYLGTAMTITRSSGAVAVIGALSKGSGSFRIDHPLPEKEATHQLVHSFIEGPQVDLIYRGKVALVNGAAQINIDEKFGMTAGTFVALCRDTQCFTTNEQGWHHVRGSVAGAVLTIECERSRLSSSLLGLNIGFATIPTGLDSSPTIFGFIPPFPPRGAPPVSNIRVVAGFRVWRRLTARFFRKVSLVWTRFVCLAIPSVFVCIGPYWGIR